MTSTQANLWGRADGVAAMYAWLGEQPDLSDACLVGTALLAPQDGFAGIVPATDLSPDTQYYYTLSLEAVPPHPGLGEYPGFRTFPDDHDRQSFAFAFGSCFLPSGSDSGEIFNDLNRLRVRRANSSERALRFWLLIGDQIYADDRNCNGLAGCGPVDEDDYRAVYAHGWGMLPFRKMLANLPAYMTLDDHEVDDDWNWTDYDRQRANIPIWNRWIRRLQRRPKAECYLDQFRVQDALQAYWEHQGMHVQPDQYIQLPAWVTVLKGGRSSRRFNLDRDEQGSFAYTFNVGAGAAFFVLDTRTRRVKKSLRDRTMLGEGQWDAVEEWLLKVKDRYPAKFIVTSSALIFRMWSDLPRDRWTGFPKGRQRLLKFLSCHQIDGVYLLTGDLHAAHCVSLDIHCPDGGLVRLWEFCATPFEQEPNWLAKATYFPLISRLVSNQQLHFVCPENNFGVVNVALRPPLPPKVSFEIHRGSGGPPIVIETRV